MNRNKGFSLLSLVVALGLLTITGAFAVQLQLREAKSRIADTWIAAQAREIDQVAAAVRVWTNSPANVANWTADTRTPIPCTSLTSAGLLPDAFGRDGVSCKSPFGTIYTIVGIRNSNDTTVPVGRVRSVIYASGSHHPTLLKRAGIPNQPADIQGLAMRTAHHLAERKVPAGWLSPGNTTATGVGRAWSKALNLWINPAPTQASAVALVGFPDLDGTDGVDPDGGNPLYSRCRVVSDTCGRTYPWGGCELGYAPTPVTCAAGETQVKIMDACGAAPMEFIQGLNATLTAGEYENISTPGRSAADCDAYAAAACQGNPDSECERNKRQECLSTPSNDVTVIATISLNNERQLATVCAYHDDSFTGTGPWTTFTRATYSTQYKNARVCCTPF